MNKFMNIKVGIALLAATVAVAGAMIGYAYFTGGGSGTGTAGVGSASTIALSSAAVTGLYPGGADVPVTVTIHNPGTGSQLVGTISGTVANGGVGDACLGAWFQVDPILYNLQVAGGASPTAVTAIRMLNLPIPQDACQGLTGMVINWTSN